MTRSSASSRRPGLTAYTAPVLLAVAFSLFAGACAGGDQEVPTDEARLTTRGAGDLLVSGAPATPASPGFDALNRPAPNTPPGDQIDLDMLGVEFGSPDAPARILEFFDFGCGFCRKFHAETLPALTDKYIDQGQLLWKAIPFVIGNWANSVPATLAAECALGQGHYEEMAETLFERQPEWKPASEPEPILEGIAEELGLDMEVYRTCMSSDEFLWRVQAHSSLARQIGVRGTPTFVVVGYAPFAGALPLELFEQIIDTVLVNAAADNF